MARADRLREELKDRGQRVGILARSGRNRPATHNRGLCMTRSQIENAFARPKDRRGIVLRYTRCGHLFLCTIALAAAVLSGLR